MKILIAPQAFKGSLDAWAAAQAIERGVKQAWPEAETIVMPVADGGDGTTQTLVRATQGTFNHTVVTDPIGRPTRAEWGILGDSGGTRTAIIEMACASGLRLVPPERRNPLITTTYGTGELIKAALDEDCTRVIVGLGGSATNDGGAGAAQALGVKLLDGAGQELPWGGAALINLAKIDISHLDVRLAGTEIIAASDVNNPLIGPLGASSVYGPQKGATPEMVAQLDRALAHYGRVISEQLGVEIRDRPGAGAAGGLGGGLIAFLNARITPGADLVLQTIGLEKRLAGVDLVITGEGQMEGQSIHGKAPVALARVAKRFGIPVLAFVGSIGTDYEVVYEHGIDAIVTIVPRPMREEQAMSEADVLLQAAAERAVRLFKVACSAR